MKHLPRLMPLIVLAAVMAIGCDGKPTQETPAVGAAPTPAPNLARDDPSAGKVDYVTVTAEGRGPTVTAAVDQAIQLAIQQVNGQTLDSSSMQFRGGMALAIGDQHVDIGSSAFAELVATRSRGAVTNFKLLSRQNLDGGQATVTIEARVAKFVKPASAGMLRIAVAAFRTDVGIFEIDTSQVLAENVVQDLRHLITNTLVQTKRVSVIDREFGAEIQGELDLIDSGQMAAEEFARMGEQLLADYLLVGHVDSYGYTRHERRLRTSDRTLISHSSGAAISLRLVNVTTGQVELAETIQVDLPATAATTLGMTVDVSKVSNELTQRLSDLAGKAVIGRLFPVTVVAVDGSDVVLSQGGTLLTPGVDYEVVLRGKEMTDPQTGRVIGRLEKPCCIIGVTRVTNDLSYATVLESMVDLHAVFAPGALEVRGPVSTARVDSKSSAAGTVAAGNGNMSSQQAEEVARLAPAASKTDDKDW